MLSKDGRAVGCVGALVVPGSGAAGREVRVAVAGGAIHTPAILARSGVAHTDLGRNLCLHTTFGVGGVFPDAAVSRTRASPWGW